MGWKENEICFYGTDSETVEKFIYWLLTTKHPFPHVDSDPSAAVCQDRASAAVKLWIFGDTYLLPRLQNIAMHVLRDATTDWLPDVETIKTAYHGTLYDCQLRRFMIMLVLRGLIDSVECGDDAGYSAARSMEMEDVPGYASDLADAFVGYARCMTTTGNEMDRKFARRVFYKTTYKSVDEFLMGEDVE